MKRMLITCLFLMGVCRGWSNTFFDEAAFGTFDLPEGRTFLNGWVSRYGALNGGEFFFTDLFQVSPAPSAQVWWNFNGQADGYWLSEIDVWGRTADGTAVAHTYVVPSDDRFVSPANLTVSLDGGATINSISFWGLNRAPVPEGGTTLLLLATAMLPILVRRAVPGVASGRFLLH